MIAEQTGCQTTEHCSNIFTKPSCAAKISQAVEAGFFGYQMYKNGQQFYVGDGIVVKGVDANVEMVGRLGRQGMKETNNKIVDMMLEKHPAH